MKGLFLADLYMAKKYCRSYFFIMAVFFVLSMSYVYGNIMFITYPMILAGLLPFTLLGYSERSKWDIYCETLPVTRRQIVTEKYLLSGGLLLVVFALIAVLQGVQLTVRGHFDAEEYSLFLTAALFAGFISPSITLPCIFKWGIEKGRIAYYIFIGIITALCTAMFEFVPRNTSTGIVLWQIQGWMICAVILLCALLFAGSWRLSVHVYEKRERH